MYNPHLVRSAPMASVVPEESTSRLLARVRDGDAEARDLLLQRLAPVLQKWASGRLPGWARDISETRDLVHDTLLHGAGRLESFEPRHDGALCAYFRQAVLNRIRDAVRRANRTPTHESLDVAGELASREPSPLEYAIGRQAIDQYERALARLKDSEREAIIGRLELGYSYQELARMLERPSAEAARLAVTRAIVRLAEEMRRDG